MSGVDVTAAADRLTRSEHLAEQIAALYVEKVGVIRDDLWHLAKLTEELGELNSAWLSANGRGRDRGLSPSELRKAVAEEAADLFGFLLLFAQRNEIDLAEALEQKWGRYLRSSEG